MARIMFVDYKFIKLILTKQNPNKTKIRRIANDY